MLTALRPLVFIFAIAVVFLSCFLEAWAATITAASCSATNIQTAINAASDGDTVTVPSGNCSWTTSVTMPNTKGLILQGAGAGRTNITMGGNQLILQTSAARRPVRITGFSFIKNSGTRWDVQITGTAPNWRIDHNTFNAGNIAGGYQVRVGQDDCNIDSYTYGLIDNNNFTNRNFVTSIFMEWPRGTSDSVACGDWVWSQPARRGTAQALYIEDNTFSDAPGAAASQVIDCRWGCMYVLRYNAISNPWISTHSGCTNQGRDPIWQEIYNNTFTQPGTPYGGNQIEMRSTSGVIFGNIASSPIRFAISIDHERSYRSDCTGPYGGRADGTRPWDMNISGQVAWRAMGQPGWGPPQATDMTNSTFAGVFAWGNLNGGNVVNLSVANNNGNTSTHVKPRREYFNSADIPSGSLSARPASCTASPEGRSIYRATDKHSSGVSLYICSAPNTWTLHYEPYTYPHPLQGGGAGGGGTVPPDSPTNLRVE